MSWVNDLRAVAALNQTNVCQLYDVGPDYVVMEYVEGTPVSPPDITRKLLDIAVQLSDGGGRPTPPASSMAT
jgi:hypothetical protein